MSERIARRWALASAAGGGLGTFVLAWLRYDTFHNETFDLAFYTRMAWGMVRFDFWDPILEAHVLGLHVSPVLMPIGLLGLLIGSTVVALLLAQSLALAGAAYCLGQLGARHLGPAGWLFGTLTFLLHPNVGHVGSFEAHPGTLALWPLAWAIERLDAADAKRFVWAIVATLLCREDFALVTAALALIAMRQAPLRAIGARIAMGSLVYLGVFVLVLHPMFAPAQGSLQAHFGSWGSSLSEVFVAWLSSPRAVLQHVLSPARLHYVALLLAPLAFLPVAAPRWWIPLAPVLAVNLLSTFPTAIDIKEHYSTPALPLLVAAAIEAITKARDNLRVPLLASVAATSLATLIAFGVNPTASVFRADARTSASRTIAEALDRRAGHHSVQAPNPILAHCAERTRVFRDPPPDRNADYVVLDASIRAQYMHSGTILRTQQEPTLRNWLSRPTYGVVAIAAPWVLLERGGDTRTALSDRYFLGNRASAMSEGRRLTQCLRVLQVNRAPSGVVLNLVATGPCPADLALRIDTQMATARTDLLFDGWLSPALLQPGDLLRSEHELPGVVEAVFLGAVRSSGARPLPDDPPWIRAQIGASP